MKLVIFAGGIGSRLWPLSRENSPKQFDKIFSGKSTLELAIERIHNEFPIEDIYVQTIGIYKNLVKEQIPELPEKNIIIEPARRNLAAAVCLSVIELKKKGYSGPLAILWADHLMANPKEFILALKTGEKLIQSESKRFIFLGENPRFANNNLGWIKVGEKINSIESSEYFSFLGWKYKPTTEECNSMFNQGGYFWNPGYFITSIDFLLEQYKSLAPNIFKDVVEGNYLNVKSIHFDRAIIEKIDQSMAVVIKTNMGWSDPGTLYALKEALEDNKHSNVVTGEISFINTNDCLLYNLEKDKIVTTVGLSGFVVVNTKDALLVAPKEEVVNITLLVQKLREEGRERFL